MVGLWPMEERFLGRTREKKRGGGNLIRIKICMLGGYQALRYEKNSHVEKDNNGNEWRKLRRRVKEGEEQG